MWLLVSAMVRWDVARGVARLRQRELPIVTQAEAVQIVASIRQHARQAGPIAARALAVDTSMVTLNIQVVDRDGWVAAASGIFSRALELLEEPKHAHSLRRRALALALGVGAGAGLRLGATRLLGQFDGFSPRRTLYLVAPNIVDYERRLGFRADAFRRWVALHEQTHALQFALAPWLPAHMMELVRRTESLPQLRQVMALMTFLEGHADYVSDHTGSVRGAQRMRDVFGRGTKRAARLHDKRAQYTNGLAFCTQVVRLAGRGVLRRPFEEPTLLPSAAEIHDAGAWVRRVHGAA